MHAFLDSPTYTWLILPLLIFFARICDMSLDTIRIIMIGQGRKGLAALAGFAEVCIWLLVARQVIVNLPNPVCFFAYAAGFAIGNYVGLLIEERLAIGSQVVRIVVPDTGSAIERAMVSGGYGVTVTTAQGAKGPVYVISSVVKRTEIKRLFKLIQSTAPGAFYTVEDVRRVNHGVSPAEGAEGFWRFLHR